MESDKSEEEHEVISRQIVDYYRKYSQNKQLPKYFSGTPLCYMPPIVRHEEIMPQPCPTVIITDANVLESELEVQGEGKAASPTSSVTSNKKLEWDNGADIGYNNCKNRLHKSTSLPILMASSHKKDDTVVKPSLTSKIVNVISYSSHGDGLKEKEICSSSSSPYEAEPPVESPSSTVHSPSPPVFSSSSSSRSVTSYLKMKIGYPDAESTPKVASDIYKKYVPKTKNKLVSLCRTKPVLVDCFERTKKRVSDKDIQTSIAEGVSKSVQTGNSLEVIASDLAETVVEKPSNQSVIIMKHESEHSSSTNTAASSCDSFKYYRNTAANDLRRTSAKSDLAVSTDSSKEIPILGQLITEKQSRNAIEDVDRSIELLQKLLKSKRYDAATKKRYIKKIVEKIVDNKYSEDSTTSSELFIPKKQNNDQNRSHENVPWRPPQISKFTVNTFNEEFLPNIPGNNDKVVLEPEEGVTSLEKREHPSSSSCESWKEDKTTSEKLLEQKQKGQGDHLVKFAMKERQHQLSWINDEISHLTKLKGLLERKVQRTTTVYVLSNIDPESCSCSEPSTSSRNYVIQTELTPTCSSSGSADFRYYDKHGRRDYHVKELTSKKEETDITRKLTSKDIEVSSSDNTTNIKVKTTNLELANEARFKVKPPSLVGRGKYETYPRSRTEHQFESSERSTKRRHTNGHSNGKQYSFDIPLSGLSNLEDRIKEIVNTYKRKTSISGKRCECTNLKSDKTTPDGNSQVHSLSRKPTEEHTNEEYQTVPNEVSNADNFERLCTSYKKSDAADIRETAKLTSRHEERGQCKCGCNCIGKKPRQNIMREELSSDRYVQCKCGCRCRQISIPLEQIIGEPSSDKSIQCECCTCTKMTIANDEVLQHIKDKNETDTQDRGSVDIPLTALVEEASSDNGVRCEKAATKSTTDTNLQTDPCDCCDKEVQTSLPEVRTSLQEVQTSSSVKDDSDRSGTSSESSSSETSTSVSGSVRSCVCCKRKTVTAKHLYSLRKKLSDQVYPLCRLCYRQNGRANYAVGYYSTPGHVCNCYTVVQTTTLNEIKRTINDLNALDDQYCTCGGADNLSDLSYCNYCKCKLRKTSKNKNGIAYMLTFENASLSEALRKKKNKKKPYLEEIKIKIPVAHKKKHKDRENKRKKARQSCDSDTSHGGTRRHRVDSLQEHLWKNRPDFVEGAEERRRTVCDSKMEREKTSDENKLLFLKNCQEYCEKNARRLFSEREMKEITRRNYRKLPEVQQKLNSNRERQMRQANRLIADVFNRKLRESVLQGNKDLPTRKKVVDL